MSNSLSEEEKECPGCVHGWPLNGGYHYYPVDGQFSLGNPIRFQCDKATSRRKL